eukprot:scaffold7133_cov119-Skeletonema_marinoi.AAC.2
MHPRTLLGVLDHIMSVEVDYNARFLSLGPRQKDMEERSLKRRAGSEAQELIRFVSRYAHSRAECAALDPSAALDTTCDSPFV